MVNTVLKQKSNKSYRIQTGWLGSVFWVVFGMTVVFVIAVFVALLWFGLKEPLIKLFNNPEIRFAVGFTLKTTFMATMGATLTAIPCGYLLARRNFPGKVVVDILLDLPIMLPPLVSGVALLIMFGPILGTGLERFGLRIVFSPLGVIVAQWFIALPLVIKMFRESFESIDPRLENVARTLGCTWDMAFFRVTLPMAGRGIFAGMAMAWARTIGEFGATAMLAGVTRMKTETLSAAVYLNMSIGEIQVALGISVLMFLTAITILLLFKIWVGYGIKNE